MPGNPLPEALITPGELRELANLFDTWTNNFHPLSPEAQDAEKTFNQKVSAIYEQRIRQNSAASANNNSKQNCAPNAAVG